MPQLFEFEFYDLDYDGEKIEGDKDLPANLKVLQMKPLEHYGMTDIAVSYTHLTLPTSDLV